MVEQPDRSGVFHFGRPGKSPMPTFFFDVTDTGQRFPDAAGTELPDLKAARLEALNTLAQIARDKLPDGDYRDFVIEIRDRERRRLLTASLSLRVRR
jgi:hypothetical protein